ncbi:ABC transporter permease [Frankia sp. CcI49]|nr:ABC transporter permease [Frankia sp. R43]ONH58775.1 ABC transporter permease [Frankia sp. CcI49]
MTEQRTAAPAEVLPGTPIVSAARRPRSFLVYLCYGWLALVLGVAVLADVLPIPSYTIPVGDPRQGPSGGFDLLLGTDSQGRPMISRAVYGAQVSLLVGTVGSLLGAAIGAALGLLAGYLGGWLDWVVRLLTDALLAFPPLILLLAISSILTPSIMTLTAGLTLLIIPTFTRLARANTLTWASRDFITAARNMGASRGRILIREILPNLLPSLAAYLPVVISALIVAEGSLSFLGAGIPPPRPSWGGMISDGKDYLVDAPHMVLIPASIIFLTVFSLNQVGDHLRHRLDRTLHD